MSNPVIKSIPEGEWTKAASAVTSGMLYLLDASVNYYQTYRLADETAPTNPVEGVLPEEAIRIFNNENQAQISNHEPIDVYIIAYDKDGNTSETGKIRVDI